MLAAFGLSGWGHNVLSEPLLRSITDSPVFEITDAAYVVVDAEVRIRAVNAAYEQVTGFKRNLLLGERLFDVFPDNPADPHATGVANLSSSLDRVLSGRRRHRIGMQRYDLPDPDDRTRFTARAWTSVNSPILDDQGRAVAVLHHAEDVTPALGLLDAGVAAADAGEERDADAPGAGPALSGVLTAYRELEDLNRNLTIALQSSRDIGTAIGILMSRRGLSREDAFGLMRAVSQRLHRKLRELAAEVIATGVLPGADDPA